MKFGALILALFILFLSVKSTVEPIATLAEVDACCKEKKEQSGQEKKANTNEDGCNDLCSPFQSCCPYISISSTRLGVSIPKTYPLAENKFSLYNISFSYNYFSDFWQPPRKVEQLS